MATSTEIYDLSLHCDENFCRITECRTARSHAVLEVLRHRFSQWAAHLGALADKSISLDTRLTHSESLRHLVTQFLQIAKRNLDRIESLESQRPNETPEFIIDQMSNPAKEDVSSRLVESLQALEAAVDGLHRLGIAIRQSSSDNLNQRIQAFIDKSDDGILQDLAYIHIKHSLVDQYVKGQGVKVNEQEDCQVGGAALSLCRQLATSVSFRYFGILYRRNHERKLGTRRESRREATNVENERQSAAKPRIDIPSHSALQTRSKGPSRIPPHISGIIRAVPSESSPSMPISRVAREQYASSQRSSVTTCSVSIHLEDVKYPDPPKADPPAKGAVCPYCCQFLEATKYDNKKWWMNHVNNDIKPWACISEECLEPPRLFAKFEQWKQHMKDEHSSNWAQKVHVPANWCCEMDHEEEWFTDEKTFEDHVRSHHSDYAEGQEMAAFKELCEIRLSRPWNMCPICNCVPDELEAIGSKIPQNTLSVPTNLSGPYEKLLRHASGHLKNIGFMSLDYLDNDEDEARSSKNTSGGEKRSVQGMPLGTWVEGEWVVDDPGSSSALDIEYRGDKLAPAPPQLQTDEHWDYVRPRLDINNLLDEITVNLKMSAFDRKDFLPQECFEKIFSDRNIDLALPGATPDLLNFIKSKAKKVFATVLLSNRQVEEKSVAIMSMFHKHDFHDGGLQLDHDPECQRFKQSQCSHADSLNLLHDENLWRGATSVKAFFKERWKFLAPIFSKTEFRHDLASEAILPIQWIEEDVSKIHSGPFSQVYEAIIYPSHQTVVPSDGPGLQVAIKKLLQSADASYLPPKKMWETELSALEAIRHEEAGSHGGLTSAIAAFQRNKEHYFILPWADGKSLQHFWEKNEIPSLSPEFIEEVLVQLHGIADALNHLHDGAKGNWRHGDIKPGNILRFRSADAQMRLGTLQLSDFGLARHHTSDTSLREPPTTMRYGTMKYEAPEAHPSVAHLGPRSRRYDIWSMGCVILEFIIWMLYGKKGLVEFDKEPVDPSGTETNFYSLERDGRIVVSSISRRWMRLMREDPELRSRGKPTALRELLDFVENSLLVVKTNERTASGEMVESEAECRATAQDLKMKLETIIGRGKADRRYLFTGRDRANIRSPQARRHHLPVSDQNTMYEHDVTDTWAFIVDNEFALEVFAGLGLDSTILPQSTSQSLCQRCQNLNFSATPFRLQHNVVSTGSVHECDFCDLLSNACSYRGLAGSIVLTREGSSLCLEGGSLPILSIYRSPEVSKELQDIQIGFPTPPQDQQKCHFKLMRQWLINCNENHTCRPQDPVKLPRRVIDVGLGQDPETVRLCETVQQHGNYVALSFPWGSVDFLVTTMANMKMLMQGISMSTLPGTFRDAVIVTRELGIPYLWVDAICIIQGSSEDWEEQAGSVEDIFSSAYCVISATRASSASSGFLKSSPPRPFATLPDNAAGHIYVCKAIDDFDDHVSEAALYRRAWIYQERVLARRTIYFANEQTYWECGHGVRCATLARMYNSKAALLGDPEFPTKLMNQSRGGVIVFYEAFYKHYSRLELAMMTDRPIAIAGLEKRLIRALGVHGGYGIIDSHKPEHASYLGRSLLWMRGADDASMTKIQFSPGSEVPSWSWMSNQGGIDYLDAPFNEVNWERKEVRSPWGQNLLQRSSWHTVDRAAGAKRLTAVAREFDNSAEGTIIYDRGSRLGEQELKCVVIGRSKSGENDDLRMHYVLIIGKLDDHEWERVGVAKLMGENIGLHRAGTAVTIS